MASQIVTYGYAVDLSGGSSAVTLTDISGWHRVRINVPTADVVTAFQGWTRAEGSREATATGVDYWRLVALLSRSFFNFLDKDTPLDVSEGGGYAKFIGGLSFTTPPSIRSENGNTENPVPDINASMLLPNTFNSMILRWALSELFGTSRPEPGTVQGITSAYNMLTNTNAARAIARDFYKNPQRIRDMMQALVTNAQERYGTSEFAGLVDTEAADVASEGPWGWQDGDILEIPLKISIPKFTKNTIDTTVPPVCLRLQLELAQVVQSWKTPYAAGVQMTPTILPEHTVIDAAVDALKGAVTATTYSEISGLITDVSNGLLTYTEARTLRDYLGWLEGGADQPPYATINVRDASSALWTSYAAVGEAGVILDYLPIDLSGGVAGLAKILSDISGTVAELRPAKEKYEHLVDLVGVLPAADGVAVPDVSAAIITVRANADAYAAEATGYETKYKEVYGDEPPATNKILRIQHNALKWWAVSAHHKNDVSGWAAIDLPGETVTIGTTPGGSEVPLYLEYEDGVPKDTIDVAPYQKDRRQEEYSRLAADLAAARALLTLAKFGVDKDKKTAYIEQLERDKAELEAAVSAANIAKTEAAIAYNELADTELVELVLDGSGELLYIDPLTSEISKAPSSDAVQLSRPIRDASGYVLDKLIAETLDSEGYYRDDPATATLGELYDKDEYSSTGPKAVHTNILYDSPYGVARLTVEEKYKRYYAPAIANRDAALTDVSGLIELILPIYAAWPILDPSGNEVPTPLQQYELTNNTYVGYTTVYDQVTATGDSLPVPAAFYTFVTNKEIYDQRRVAYTKHVTDVSGWIHAYNGTYTGTSTDITDYYTNVNSNGINDPFFRLVGGGFSSVWNSGGDMNSLFYGVLGTVSTFDAAKELFEKQAPKDGNNSDLAHTTKLVAFMRPSEPREPKL